MKKFITLTLAMMSFMAINAQTTVDTSTWKAGDDVSDAVGFGNRSFESSPCDYWQYTSNGGNITDTGGLFEIYNGSECDLWQYIYLPAGMYNLECQGYYRNGNSWSEDPGTWNNGTWVNRSQLYVEAGTYDIDSEEFVQSGVSFEGVLMPRLFDIQEYQLYWGPQSGEDGYPGWDMSDGYYNNTTYGPTSIPGSLVWFENEKYMPYSDDVEELYYNTVTFFVTEDTWVKVGVRKPGVKDADTFMVTNFSIIYQGDAGEQAQIALALKSLYAAQEKADALAESILDEYVGLGTLCQDVVMTYEYDDSNLESIAEATEAYRNMLVDFNNALRDARALSSLIKGAETLAETTDYKGKAEFLEAIEAAKKVAEDGNDGGDITITDFSAYAEAKAALADAQVAYILSQEVTGGYSDYTYAINQPFFTDAAYIPTWDEETQTYRFSDEIENTWMTIQEQGYAEALAANPDWIPICDSFTLTNDETAENCWVIHQTTWHGGGMGGVTMQHGYPALGGWTAEPSGNPERIYQTITGLPDGFYSMSALMCNAGADISDLMFVYIENSDGDRETAPLTQKGNPWWGGNRDQWRQTVWEKLTTGMVKVSDGRVTIGVSSDFFYAATGFQLYYYGENPDFSSMIQQKLAAIQSDALNKLTFPGDVTKVDELLSAITLPVEGFEAYDAANKALSEAEEYIATAYKYIDSWNLLDQVVNDQSDYETSAPEYDILENVFNYVMMIGANDDDTYLTAQKATEDYNALRSYLNYRNTITSAASYNAEIPAIIERQNATLINAELIDAELVATLRAELEAAYDNAMTDKNAQLFAELGADKATVDNPVEITQLLVNPSFDNGSTGWTGSITVDNNLHNAERFNTTFNFSQTIASLPAGCYVARVQAFYRDGGVGNTTSGGYYNWWTAADGDINLWENHNAEFYAKSNHAERVSYITSICSEKYTDRSIEKILNRIDDSNAEQQLDENGDPVVDENGNEVWVNIDTLWYRYNDEEPSWQFDVSVSEEVAEGDTVTYFYPNSMTGADARFTKNPESYQNEVAIMLLDGESLTIGLRKNVEISNDWCLFDNFRLFYLGKEAPVGIEYPLGQDNQTAAHAIYNLQGQRVNTLQRGINIVDGKKIFVK